MESYARLWVEVAVLVRGMKHLSVRSIEATGVPCELAGMHVLGRLDQLGPVRLTDLSHGLGLDPSSVSRQVTALERSGWVTREKDPSDLRAQQLVLTDSGRQMVDAVREERAAALERLTPDWTAEQVDDLTARLARLNHDLEVNGDRPEPQPHDRTEARLENA